MSSVRLFERSRKDPGDNEEEDRNNDDVTTALAAVVDAGGSSGDVWNRIAVGLLRVFLGGQYDALVSQADLMSCLARIGVDFFVDLLLVLMAHCWASQTSGEKMGKEGQDVSNGCLGDHPVLRPAYLAAVAESDLLSVFFSPLLSRASDTSKNAHVENYADVASSSSSSSFSREEFEGRAYAALVLHSVVRGAISRKIHTDMSLRFVYRCSKELLSAMSGIILPSDVVTLVMDDAFVTLKCSLLFASAHVIEDLSELHARWSLHPVGADVVLVLLMGLLRDAAQEDQVIQQTARNVLKKLAEVSGCESESKLILRHVNFIVSRLVCCLHEKWAGDVLAFIVSKHNEDVSREVTGLLETTLRDMCDGMAAASEPSALRALAAVESVLITAFAQQEKNSPPSKLSQLCDKDNASILEKDMVRLKKSLIYYCTDDVPNYEELLHANGHTENTDWFGGDEEEDQEEKSNAFQAVAIHTLEGTRDLLVGCSWHVRAAALRCATLAVRLLKGRRKILLPHVANILPLLPEQFVLLQLDLSAGDRMLMAFKRKKASEREDGEHVSDLVAYLNSKGAELPVVRNACLLVAAFAKCAGSFIQDRFVKLIYPKMRPLLRLASCFPTLLVSSRSTSSTMLLSPPGHGAMAAADAAMEAIASIALVLPSVLAPYTISLVKFLVVFFDERHSPDATSKTKVMHMNPSMIRYERERWHRRVTLAEQIVSQLKIVSAGDVLCGLLCFDETVPDAVIAPHEDLYNIEVRARRLA